MSSRRSFITLLGGAAAWPLAARAQQAGKIPTIGFLGPNTPATQSHLTAAFVQRLRRLGWVEGRNVAIEYRWAEGRYERYGEIAAEFVRLNVDVVVTSTSSPAQAVKQVTSAIPIVVTAINPDLPDLVESLARPGGNVTGISSQNNELAGKRLQLLREVVPSVRRLGHIVKSGSPSLLMELKELQAAARALGLELFTVEIRQAEDIVPAFDRLKGQADALYVSPEPLVFVNRINPIEQHPQQPVQG